MQGREDFKISKCKQFEYSSEERAYVVIHPHIDSSVSQAFKLNKRNEVSLPNSTVYNDVLP